MPDGMPQWASVGLRIDDIQDVDESRPTCIDPKLAHGLTLTRIERSFTPIDAAAWNKPGILEWLFGAVSEQEFLLLTHKPRQDEVSGRDRDPLKDLLEYIIRNELPVRSEFGNSLRVNDPKVCVERIGIEVGHNVDCVTS